MKNSCKIPFEVRLDYHEGRTNPTINTMIQRHVADDCDSCKRDLAWLASYLPAVRSALQFSEQSVSDWAMNRARSIMQTNSSDSVASRLMAAAQLLFDSRSSNLAFASARDGLDGSVHVVYRTQNADVDLWQEQSRVGNWYMTGQALSLGKAELDPPRAASLISDVVGTQFASIENAEFSFESLAAGKYCLSLLWDDMEIRVDDLAVGFAEAS